MHGRNSNPDRRARGVRRRRWSDRRMAAISVAGPDGVVSNAPPVAVRAAVALTAAWWRLPVPEHDAASDALLATLEDYFDAVPRDAARAEEIGPFTLFVQEQGGWPYYARPRRGATAFTPADVAAVRARQRALGVPEAFEWVEETTPGVRPAAAAAGLPVADRPLMVLADADAGAVDVEPPAGVTLRLVAPEDDLARLYALVGLAFGTPGTEVGDAGVDQLAGAPETPHALVAFTQARLRAGRTVMAVALVDGQPVGAG